MSENEKSPVVAEMPAAGHSGILRPRTGNSGNVFAHVLDSAEASDTPKEFVSRMNKQHFGANLKRIWNATRQRRGRLVLGIPKRIEQKRTGSRGDRTSVLKRTMTFEETNVEPFKTDEEWLPEDDWLKENLMATSLNKTVQMRKKRKV